LVIVFSYRRSFKVNFVEGFMRSLVFVALDGTIAEKDQINLSPTNLVVIDNGVRESVMT